MEQIVMEDNDTVPYIPQEIITNILRRLPVKSLIRFQCVCKDWKNLFKTSSFIAEHLHHSTQQNPLLLVDCTTCEGKIWHLCLLTREKQVLEFQNPPIIDSLMDSWSTVHSSNGLLCVQLIDKSHSFLLWNPIIREVRQVPKSHNNYDYVNFSVGFGFSPIINDYKIVKIFMIDDLVALVEVYSLNTGLWRKVELRNLEGVTLSSYKSVTCNGAIFWCGLKEGVENNNKRDLQLIVSFDIATEVLTLMPFPTSVPISYFNSRFIVYENKLAVLCPTVIGNFESSLIDLWVMEECTDASNERWSWTKIYTSRSYPCLLSPKIIWGNEIVCKFNSLSREIEGELGNDEEKVVLCNLTTNQFNMFAIPKCSNSYRILNYVESLVSVANIHI